MGSTTLNNQSRFYEASRQRLLGSVLRFLTMFGIFHRIKPSSGIIIYGGDFHSVKDTAEFLASAGSSLSSINV